MSRQTSTYGPEYVEELDGARIHKQMDTIREFMLSHWPKWFSLAEIEKALDYPQASISAQLRHLRKPKFGSYNVEKQRRSNGTWEYRVGRPKPVYHKTLFPGMWPGTEN